MINLATLNSIAGQSVTDGRHLLTLWATDAAGNESSTEFQFDLDRQGPPLQTPPDLMTSSDLGHSDQDNLTSETEPVVRVFAQRGALVKFYVDGTLSGEIYSTGAAQYTLPSLTNGTYNVTTTIEDAAGNVAGPSEPLVLTIDSFPPSDLTLELMPLHQSSVRANHTTDAQVSLIGTAEPGSRITMTGQRETPIADAEGTFFFVTDLQVGSNEFLVISEDPAGNRTEQTVVFTRGAVLPPEFTFTSVIENAITPPMIHGRLRSETAIAVAEVSTDPTFTRRVVDLTPYTTADRFVLTPSDVEAIHGAPFVDGDHALYFRATTRAEQVIRRRWLGPETRPTNPDCKARLRRWAMITVT